MIVLALVPASILWALTVATLYGWFLAPIGAPDLGVAHLYGISVLVQFVTVGHTPDTDAEEVVVQSVIRCLVALAVGWVALQFMGGAA